MARQNGQATWVTPTSNASLGDDASSTATRRIFTATERMTLVEVGAIVGDIAHVPSNAFAFKAFKRTCGDSASDFTIPLFKSTFAAEGGVSGDPSILNNDFANQLPNGIVTNTAALAAGNIGFGGSPQKCVLRAYTELTFAKGDQLVIAVTTGGGASSTVVFYAKAYYDGSGLVEDVDADSN